MTSRWPTWRTDLAISLASLLGGLALYATGGWRLIHPTGWVEGPVLLIPLTVMAGACLLRRLAPGTGLAIGIGALIADLALGSTLGTTLIFTQVIYDACVYGRPWLWRASLIGGVTLSVLGAAFGIWAAGTWRGVVVGMVVALIVVLPTLTGISVRQFRDQARVQRARAEETARLAAWERRQAVADERARMARELHDVVANQLSAIAIHSTALLSAPDPSPQLVREAVALIRENSVSGLAEMRQMIGLLRDSGSVGDDETQRPGLAALNQLVGQAEADGLTVEVQATGVDRPLPVSVDFAAHRIVRESLTNAWKHGTGQATLRVDVDADRVLIEVVNAIRAGTDPPSRAGHGLIGMRERVALLHGTITAHPVDGSWQVLATLPARHTEMESVS